MVCEDNPWCYRNFESDMKYQHGYGHKYQDITPPAGPVWNGCYYCHQDMGDYNVLRMHSASCKIMICELCRDILFAGVWDRFVDQELRLEEYKKNCKTKEMYLKWKEINKD